MLQGDYNELPLSLQLTVYSVKYFREAINYRYFDSSILLSGIVIFIHQSSINPVKTVVAGPVIYTVSSV